MEVAFRLVDAFTETAFEGNRLCVVPEAPHGLSTEQMQMLALEMNFSETTFVTESRPEGYRMRIFTPDAELPFAGHPTLGTAFTLASEGRTYPHTIQTTAIGEVPVEVDLARGFAWMTQRPPVFGAEFDDRELVAEAAGLEPEDLHPDLPMQVISTGLGPLIVPVRDEAALRRAERIDPPPVGRRSAPAASASTCSPCVVRRRDRQDVRRRSASAKTRRPAAPSGRSASPRVARARGHAGRRGGRARRAGRPTELPAPGRPRGRGRVAGPRRRRRPDRRRGALPAGRLERLADRAGLQTDPESPWSTFTVSISAIPGSKGAELTYAAVSFRNVARPTSTETLQRTCDGSLPRFVTLKLKQAGVPPGQSIPSGSATSNRGGRSFRS